VSIVEEGVGQQGIDQVRRREREAKDQETRTERKAWDVGDIENT
jgi:hypothetical protein